MAHVSRHCGSVRSQRSSVWLKEQPLCVFFSCDGETTQPLRPAVPDQQKHGLLRGTVTQTHTTVICNLLLTFPTTADIITSSALLKTNALGGGRGLAGSFYDSQTAEGAP